MVYRYLEKIRNKQFRRIGFHLVVKDDPNLDDNDSPILIRFKGCERNIRKYNVDKEECLIYPENNKGSRIITRRIEKDIGIKPYETLQNIIYKNNLITELNEEERKDEEYNKKIDYIDKIIIGEEKLLTFIKNCILEEEHDYLDQIDLNIIIRCTKIKKKVVEKVKKLYDYLVTWVIRETLQDVGKELFFTFKYSSLYENEYKIVIRSLIMSLLIVKIRLM